ncbi:MAG TPA: tRNA (guanine(46)-N(7))-methyltransferase TrmB [Hyphomicrobiaceae bacterium]|jgi:tRNA (guanine-N7-)-methyltransferase|nr:tRNA (guanine(46)-N(7))-methyltransferase TrmB [Hyphomicrobiaceae bacterium]
MTHGEHELRSFGRRRTRKLSAAQAALWQDVLPRVAVPLDANALADLRALFSPPVRWVGLEIGFGSGEHLLCQAEQHPEMGFLGCEPYVNGVIKVLSRLRTAPDRHVRIHADDGRALLRLLPAGGIERVYILFPDPWPKKRHRKRRLVSRANLAEIARIMSPGGELRIATDVGDYASEMLQAVLTDGSFHWQADGPRDWRDRTPDWPPTRYEQKARAAGRRCYYFRFCRI